MNKEIIKENNYLREKVFLLENDHLKGKFSLIKYTLF